jgi:hypothetical protein
MRTFTLEPRRHTSDFSPREILLRRGHQFAGDPAPSHRVRHNQHDDLAGKIVMQITRVRNRVDHSTKFSADLRDKCFVARVLEDSFQTRRHLNICRLVTQLASERSKLRRVVQSRIAHR